MALNAGMIFASYTSRGVLYAAKMIVGVAGGVHEAPPDAASPDDDDDEHAPSARTDVTRNAGRNR
jgi:hypothetical protein